MEAEGKGDLNVESKAMLGIQREKKPENELCPVVASMLI